MEIQEYVDKWLVCKTLYYEDEYLKIDELILVHNLDRGLVKNNSTRTLFRCTGVFDDLFLILKSKTFCIRVKVEAVSRVLPYSKFDYDDQVKELNKPELVGKIDLIIWHEKNFEYKYCISINGKPKSRRYSPNELEQA